MITNLILELLWHIAYFLAHPLLRDCTITIRYYTFMHKMVDIKVDFQRITKSLNFQNHTTHHTVCTYDPAAGLACFVCMSAIHVYTIPT